MPKRQTTRQTKQLSPAEIRRTKERVRTLELISKINDDRIDTMHLAFGQLAQYIQELRTHDEDHLRAVHQIVTKIEETLSRMEAKVSAPTLSTPISPVRSSEPSSNTE
jgi:Fe-S-cluster formation regulator IscX/YfhJ